MRAIYWTRLLKLVLQRHVKKCSLDSTDSGCYRMTRCYDFRHELSGVISPKDALDYNPSTQYFYEDSSLLECCVVLTTNNC
jgi:hypothetical protein